MRFTIRRLMTAIAVFGVNIGLLRTYLLTEQSGEHLDLFNYWLLMFFALQFGLWRYLRTVGWRRRFYLGFEICGLAATVAVQGWFASDIDLDNWYTGAASDLCYLWLPRRVDAFLIHEQHWDWFLAVIYSLPELFAATLGGLFAVCVFRSRGIRDRGKPILADPCPRLAGSQASQPGELMRTITAVAK